MFFEEYEVSANALRLMDAENAARILEHVEDYEVRRISSRGSIGEDGRTGLMIGEELIWGWKLNGNKRAKITGLFPTGNSIA